MISIHCHVEGHGVWSWSETAVGFPILWAWTSEHFPMENWHVNFNSPKTHLGGFKDFLFLPTRTLRKRPNFESALVFSIGLKRPTSKISPLKIDAWKMLHFLSHGPFSGDIPQFFGGGETSSLHTATLENKMIWAGEQHHFKMWNFIILKPVLDRSLRPEELLWINQTWDVWFFFCSEQIHLQHVLLQPCFFLNVVSSVITGILVLLLGLRKQMTFWTPVDEIESFTHEIDRWMTGPGYQ